MDEKYSAALEEARKLYNASASSPGRKEWLVKIFPELAESKDEEIRKSLLRMISDIDGGYPFENYGIIKKEAISYLEKQKEQKKPVERSLEDNHIIGFVYDLLNEVEWKDSWAMSKEECLRQLNDYRPQKPAECSEDERIRKYLIGYVKNAGCGSDLFDSINTKEAILVYLEKQKEPEDKGEISDGYHTFNELYYYRMLYNAAFFNLLPKELVHKSKRHHDGKECFGGGWFIVMANLPTGQISNHYELKDWDLFQIPEKDTADEWDGHTPQEAAERIHKYLLETQKEQKPVKMVHIPKFRVGDIVQHVHEKWDRTMKIAEIDEYGYRYDFSHRGHPVWGGGFGFTCEDDYELVERKPVMWSEEDEKQYQFVLDELRYAYSELTCHNSTIDSIKQFEKAVAWLDDRVKFICPQAKQEWSKEDKGNLLAVRCIIDGVWHDQNAREKMERSEEELESLWKWLDNIWTKVVYPESQWKPSEEQMDALNYVRQFDYGGHKATLESLYDDLKKL